MSVNLHGLWIPIVTPFTADLDVDAGALSRLAARLLDEGATGLVILGTTGEPATLSPKERRLVVETCAQVCRKRHRPFIVGAGTNSTAATVDEVTEWSSIVPDATAIMVVVPYYTRPSEPGVIDHYRVVAAASPLPIVAYNVPYRTGRGLGAEALIDLAGTPGIAGVKQAVGSLDRDTLAVLRDQPPEFQVLAGDDAFIGPLLLMGGAGAISAAAHLRTAEFAALVAAGLANDVSTMRSLAAELLATVDAGFAEPSPAVFKAALAANGEIASSGVRPPMTAASHEALTTLLQTLPSGHASSHAAPKNFDGHSTT